NGGGEVEPGHSASRWRRRSPAAIAAPPWRAPPPAPLAALVRLLALILRSGRRHGLGGGRGGGFRLRPRPLFPAGFPLGAGWPLRTSRALPLGRGRGSGRSGRDVLWRWAARRSFHLLVQVEQCHDPRPLLVVPEEDPLTKDVHRHDLLGAPQRPDRLPLL